MWLCLSCLEFSFRWKVGPYSNCSSLCGFGVRHRNVYCVTLSPGQPMAADNRSVCPGLEPPPSTTCHVQECPPFWHISEWSMVIIISTVLWKYQEDKHMTSRLRQCRSLSFTLMLPNHCGNPKPSNVATCMTL